jgi:hypothetical protein
MTITDDLRQRMTAQRATNVEQLAKDRKGLRACDRYLRWFGWSDLLSAEVRRSRDRLLAADQELREADAQLDEFIGPRTEES